jgi:hypothetical protein
MLAILQNKGKFRTLDALLFSNIIKSDRLNHEFFTEKYKELVEKQFLCKITLYTKKSNIHIECPCS